EKHIFTTEDTEGFQATKNPFSLFFSGSSVVELIFHLRSPAELWLRAPYYRRPPCRESRAQRLCSRHRDVVAANASRTIVSRQCLCLTKPCRPRRVHRALH